MRFKFGWCAGFLITCFASAAMAAEGASKLELGGDIRFRNESTYIEGSSPATSHQQRLAFRLSGKAQVHESVAARFRLATGTGRQTTNQTLGDSSGAPHGFANYPFNVDQAYIEYSGIGPVRLVAGRVPNTLQAPLGSDLVWDSDLNFDGIVAVFRHEPTGLFAHSGLNFVSMGSTNPHLSLGTFQLGVRRELGSLRLALMGSFYLYGEMAQRMPAIGGALRGNTAAGGGTYASDFRVVDAGLEVGTDFGGVPVVVGGQYIQNAVANAANEGYLVGVKAGSTKAQGDWMALYDYRKLSANSTVGVFVDGDSFAGAGTDAQGHRVRVAYVIVEGFFTTLTGMLGEGGVSSGTPTDRSRVNVDFTLQF